MRRPAVNEAIEYIRVAIRDTNSMLTLAKSMPLVEMGIDIAPMEAALDKFNATLDELAKLNVLVVEETDKIISVLEDKIGEQ